MPWFDSLDEGLKEHIATKGWDKLELEDAIVKAVTSQREAEKLIGAPSDQVVRLPKDGTDPNFDAIWHKVSAIGKPKDGYEFEGIEDAGFKEFVQSTFLKHNIPPSVAKSLAADWNKYTTDAVSDHDKETADAAVAEQTKLYESWGAEKDHNLFLAQKGAEALGLNKDFVDEMQKQVGFTATLDGLRRIGAQTGEASFLKGNAVEQTTQMTKDQAIARKNEILQEGAGIPNIAATKLDDKTFSERVVELKKLDEIILGPEADWHGQQGHRRWNQS